MHNRDRRCNYVKDVRQQLGLIPVVRMAHFVWSVFIQPDGDGNHEVKGQQWTGEKAFSAIIPSGRLLLMTLPSLTA